jgi:hypothetical protein
MNLYLLFAIALGAISGISEPSVAPRAFASVMDVRRARAGRRAIAAARVAFTRGASQRGPIQSRPLSFLRIDAPLSGAASPRAPAL